MTFTNATSTIAMNSKVVTIADCGETLNLYEPAYSAINKVLGKDIIQIIINLLVKVL